MTDPPERPPASSSIARSPVDRATTATTRCVIHTEIFLPIGSYRSRSPTNVASTRDRHQIIIANHPRRRMRFVRGTNA